MSFLIKKKIKGVYKYTYFLGICIKKKKATRNHSNYIESGKDKETMVLHAPCIEHVGKYTYSYHDLQVFSKDTTIGAFCSIGQKVVLGHGTHPLSFLSSSPYFYFKNLHFKSETTHNHDEFWDYPAITIGNDVWIGDGVFVKNGIKIGDGAVIGAHSLVTKDVPPYAIVAGVPAKIIRYRFPEKIIADLLELKWWCLPDEVIKQIPYDDIEQAIAFLKKRNKK